MPNLKPLPQLRYRWNHPAEVEGTGLTEMDFPPKVISRLFLEFFECNIITCKHQHKVLTYNNQDVYPGGDELQGCTDTKNQVMLT